MILVVLENQNTKNEATKLCNEPGIHYEDTFIMSSLYGKHGGNQITHNITHAKKLSMQRKNKFYSMLGYSHTHK